MKVLITGADGQLGRELRKLYPDAIGTSHDPSNMFYLQIEDQNAFEGWQDSSQPLKSGHHSSKPDHDHSCGHAVVRIHERHPIRRTSHVAPKGTERYLEMLRGPCGEPFRSWSTEPCF